MTTEKGWSKYVADILSVKYIKVKVFVGISQSAFHIR